MPDWNERYRRGEHVSHDPLRLLVEKEELVAQAAGGRGQALDLACGTGRHALFLAHHGWRVVAVDASAVAIEILQKESGGLPVDARVADLEDESYTIAADSHDLILDCCYLHRPLFAGIRSGSRRGGVFLAVIPLISRNPAVPPMNPDYLLEPGELEAEFSGWKILHLDEGALRENQRPMVEMIAQRPLSR